MNDTDKDDPLAQPLPPGTVALLNRAAAMLRPATRQPLADEDDDMA